MQRQVEQVISERILAAHLVVQPEREVGQRPGLPQRPDVQPAARRGQGRVGENGIIVKVKTRTERSAKGNQRSGKQKKTRPHDLLRAYVKRPQHRSRT